MILSLSFDERVYREIAAPSFKEFDKKVYTDIGLHVIVGIIFLTIAFAAFMLLEESGYFMGLLMGSLFFAAASLISIPLTVIKIRKKRNKFNSEVEAFIDKCNSVKHIEYEFDEQLIKYYESGKHTLTFEWAKLDKGYIQDEFIYLLFENRQNIMIPLKMADSHGYEEFKALTKKKTNAT